MPPPRQARRHESTGLSLGVRDKLRAGVLSGVAGYVDAAGLVSVVALFPAHITGELVSEAVALSSGHRDGGPSRLWMLPVFVIAVALAAFLARLERERGRQPLPVLLLLVAAGLGSFAFSGLLAFFSSSSSPVLSRLGSCCAVAAMGFQNALMREALTGSAPTTFMTGNLTQLVIELVEHAFSLGRRVGVWSDVQRSISRSRLRTAAIALASFLSSAVLGACLTRAVGALSAILPAALVGLLSWQAYRERRGQTSATERAQPAHHIGMRRPTPLNRPLYDNTRPESGTRFKAVRLADLGPPVEGDDVGSSGTKSTKAG